MKSTRTVRVYSVDKIVQFRIAHDELSHNGRIVSDQYWPAVNHCLLLCLATFKQAYNININTEPKIAASVKNVYIFISRVFVLRGRCSSNQYRCPLVKAKTGDCIFPRSDTVEKHSISERAQTSRIIIRGLGFFFAGCVHGWVSVCAGRKMDVLFFCLYFFVR